MRLTRSPIRMVALVVVAAALSGCSVAVIPTRTASPADHGAPVGLVRLHACPLSPADARRTDLAGASTLLLPFIPTAMLLCRYGGLNSGHSQALVEARSLTPSQVVSMTKAVNAASDDRWGPGPINCPADFDAATNVFAEDGRSGRWFALRIDRAGCATIRNGSIDDARVSDRLERSLTRFVGAPGM